MKSGHVIGLDIGGTQMKLAVFDSASWKIVSEEILATEAERGFADVQSRAFALITKHRTADDVPVGVCVPGPIKQPEGVLLRAPNIADSQNIPLLKNVIREFGKNVAVENDARCFALAEASIGAGATHSVVCGITIGTGVGGGLVVDGKIFHGANGFAGELGHILLKPGMPPFETSDKRGDAEQFLSGTAFAERCKAAQSPDDYLQGETCEFLYPEIFQEVAWLCTTITHAYDPSIIVFGGSTGRALKPHLSKIEQELSKWLLPPVKSPKLAIAELNHPGALGAALLAVSVQ